MTDYGRQFFGLDCNGFVGNYWGLSPGLSIGVSALGEPGKLLDWDTCKQRKYGRGRAELLSAPDIPLTPGQTAAEARNGDILITALADSHYKHIATVDRVLPLSDDMVTWTIVERGSEGDESSHSRDANNREIGPRHDQEVRHRISKQRRVSLPLRRSEHAVPARHLGPVGHGRRLIGLTTFGNNTMALAIFSKKEFPWADDYFRCFPAEPLGPGLAPPQIRQSCRADDINLETIFSIVGTSWSDWRSDLLIASHGATEAIMLGLSFDRPQSLTLADLKVLCKLSPDESGILEVAKRFGLDERVIRGIRNGLMNFRRCGLRTLAVRACKIGNNERYLLKLAELLNVECVSAPLDRDFFGRDKNPEIAPTQVPRSGKSAVKSGANREMMPAFEAVLVTFPQGKPYGVTLNRLFIGFEKLKKPSSTSTRARRAKRPSFTAAFSCSAPPPTRWSPADGFIIFGIQKKVGEVCFPAEPRYARRLTVVKNPKYQRTEAIMPPLPMVPFKDEQVRRGGKLRQLAARVFSRATSVDAIGLESVTG
jgi:hypothetical protein